MDAFAQQDWHSTVSFCHPPPVLLNKLAAYLADSAPSAKVVVLAPYWPAQMWYAALYRLAGEVLRLDADAAPLVRQAPWPHVLFVMNLQTGNAISWERLKATGPSRLGTSSSRR